RGRESRAAGRARLRAWLAQDILYAQRRLAVDAVAQGRARPGGGFRDGLQPERLRRTALGRAGKQRGSFDLQAPCAAGAARQDVVGLPHLVPRAALADPRLALQLPFLQVSESMGNHDSKIVDAASV